MIQSLFQVDDLITDDLITDENIPETLAEGSAALIDSDLITDLTTVPGVKKNTFQLK